MNTIIVYYILFGVIGVSLFVVLVTFLNNLQLKRLRRKYNPDENKTKPTGETAPGRIKATG